jgi:hypothetical protein
MATKAPRPEVFAGTGAEVAFNQPLAGVQATPVH